MKIMVTLLTHHSSARLKRLVQSVMEVHPVPGVEMHPVVVVNSMNPNYYQEVLDLNLPVPVINTESNGRPGKGKNACLDYFLKSNCDFVSQIDGDDILYPTYLQSLWAHIKHYPCIDVLGIIPTDVIDTRDNVGGHKIDLPGNLFGHVWGISLVSPDGRGTAGPSESRIWREEYPCSHDFIILQSRKSAKIKMDEHLAVAEDHLYTFQLLAEHQRGDLCYFNTMSSDMYLIDRTTDNSVQKEFPYADWVDEFRQRTEQYVPRWRSSYDELPYIFKDILMYHHQKEEWMKDFIARNPV